MSAAARCLVNRFVVFRPSAPHRLQLSASLSSASALSGAAKALQNSLVNASWRPHIDGGNAGESNWPGTVGDWSSARDQMDTISCWPSHLLTSAEQLALTEAFVSRAASVLDVHENNCGKMLCSFFEQLLQPGALIGPCRADGAVHCAVVAVMDACHLQAASCEVAAMLLSGHAVSLAAPRGPALEAAQEITQGFPQALLQAIELGPLITLPVTVRSFRAIGSTAQELWTEKAPPGDFGGLTFKAGIPSAHGMAAAAPLSLAHINVKALELSSRSHFRFNDETSQLVDMLPGNHGSLEQVHDMLDLLWACRCQDPMDMPNGSKRSLSLAPAHKHLLLTFVGSYMPEDVVKAAIISALSPFSEPITLHCVGLGSQALARDPLRSFLRLVQSGRSGLRWHVHEHKDWAAFLVWLHGEVDAGVENGSYDPVYLFSTLRNLELEVKRSCAQAGGIAWVKLFLPDLLEVLRRWTRVVETETQRDEVVNVLPQTSS